MARRIITIFTFFVFNVFFVFSLLISPASAAGASLFLSPASGSYKTGTNFTIKVMVNSGGGAGINAAEGVVNFDKDILNVKSVDKNGSIFSLWTAEPSFSNSSGQIKFGGGSPSPYTGGGGTIINIVFSPIKAGTANVTITGGMVLAADGKGTNVFSGAAPGTYTVSEPEIKETPKETPQTETKEEKKSAGFVPPAPEVSSETHPEEDKWYSNNTPEFIWKLLSDVSGVSYAINEDAEDDPGSESDGVVESEIFKDIEDGEWYFHIKFRNKSGWGSIAHRKFMVDITPPTAFELVVNNENDPTNPTPILEFLTEDKTSGLEKYIMRLDNETFDISPNQVVEGKYKLKLLDPGEHTVIMSALDGAGNAASSTRTFIVEPLKPPIITEMPSDITTREALIIRGTSFYPQVTIEVNLALEGEDPQTYKVKTDDQGNWSFFMNEHLEKGIYDVWARVIDKRGAKSFDSAKNTLRVTAPSFLTSYGWITIIILLILVIVEELIIFYMRYKFNEERKRIMRETVEAKETVSKVFNALKEELDEQMEFADKRKGLSESERRVKNRMQEALTIAQEFIDKEIDDAEKEIKIKQKKS